jgi:hypothetical protein
MIQRPVYAIDPTFDTFIGSLYADRTIPPVVVLLDDKYDATEYFRRTRCIPVLEEDESADCPVFGNWGTYYEFVGWAAYRAISGNAFELMVADVVSNVAWSPDTAKWISIIHGLVVVQEKYADAFGHYPVDLTKFIKSYLRYGEATVLNEDRY